MIRVAMSMLVVGSLLLDGIFGSALGNPLVLAQGDDGLVAVLEADGGDDGRQGRVDPSLLVATSEIREASAYAECDDPNGFCAYLYSADWDRPLVMSDDGAFEWEGPFAAGTYEAQPRGDSIYLAVILTSEDGDECLGSYDSFLDQIEIQMSDCPGFTWENQYNEGEIQELNAGSLIFVPER